MCSFKDKSVQKDAKMVSYGVVDKAQKPYVEVEVAGSKKVSILLSTLLCMQCGVVLKRAHASQLESRAWTSLYAVACNSKPTQMLLCRYTK